MSKIARALSSFIKAIFTSFLTGTYYDMWSSFPPLSTNESTVDVYCCVGRYIFYNALYYRGYLNISVALIEAENTSLPWSYSTILNEYCASRHYCYNLWYGKYINYLTGSHTYSDLTPNTLYTVAVLACYPPYSSCTVGGASYYQYSSITTRPEGMNSTTYTHVYVHT